MEEHPEPPSWQTSDTTFTFHLDAPNRIPRGWERAPKSPYGTRHGGRKVWKRYETVPKDHDAKLSNEERADAQEGKLVLGDATNTSRSVKRMRVKDGAEDVAKGKENRPSKYLATLREKAPGTPRRKQAPRKSLKSDHEKSPMGKVKNGPAEVFTEPEDVVEKEGRDEAREEVVEDVLGASKSPMLQDAVEERLQDSKENEVLEEVLDTSQSLARGTVGAQSASETEGTKPTEGIQEDGDDQPQGEVAEDTFRASQSPALQEEAAEPFIESKTAASMDTLEAMELDKVPSVQEDSLRASQSPALDDVRKILGTTNIPKDLDHEIPGVEANTRMEDNEKRLAVNEALHEAESPKLPKVSPQAAASMKDHGEKANLLQGETVSHDDNAESTLGDPSSPVPEHSKRDTMMQGLDLQTPEGEAVSLSNEPPSSSELEAGMGSARVATNNGETLLSDPDAVPISEEQPGLRSESVVSHLPAATPGKTSAAKPRRSKQILDASSPCGSPQIGTSLLRRESLRKRETPSKKKDPRKTRNPKKRDTLSRRDTLQEREILQKVIAETNEEPNAHDADHTVVEAQIPSSDDLLAKPHDEQYLSLEVSIDEEPITDNAITGAENAVLTSDDAKVERDLHRAMEAIEVFEHPTSSDVTDVAVPVCGADVEEITAIDKANEMIAKAELEEADQMVETIQEQTELPSRKTRSAARFSDDTSMLRDFLNRAQASKAAKTPVLLPLDAPNPQSSPRRSPRKALGSHKINTPAFQKPEEITNRPGTPRGVAKADILDSDDADGITATPTSCRRSTRTRLPAPSKAAPGAPSFIPVRRADGTDPVVLQKSQAQELAMVTRANTRRNKGQSKPPLLALKDLPVDSAAVASAKERADNSKAVGWAKTLASYQDPKDDAEEIEENKPKVRRMRGLGSVNGTPAAKKNTGVMCSSNGTPARRGKVR